MYKKIMFCADLYASSDYAFASALDLVERSGAELIIIHVLESRNRYSGQFITEDGEAWGSEEAYDKLKGLLKEYYFSRIEAEEPENVRIVARGGIPWVEILRFARKESVDLIVMGSYTIKDPKKAPVIEKPHLGENAQQVTLRARCQVSTITSPKQQLSLKGE